uniref:Uncharacterized protein n=1 Tax=Timema cristinae TaxID=61476 RepID=A0A7R9D305_TIMCR|nr:unnamed protein product [Timema cristinae]
MFTDTSRHESTMLLAVWLAVHSMMPIVALAAVVWGTVMMAIHSNVEHIFIVLFPSLAAIGVLMYFIVVVHSYRMHLKSNRVQDVERFPASYVTNKKSLAIPQRRGKYPSNDFY